MSDPDMDGVIAGLSEMQRRVVLHNREDGGLRYGWHQSGSASRALERKGILREGSDCVLNIMWKLTPLGQQIRARLLSQKSERKSS